MIKKFELFWLKSILIIFLASMLATSCYSAKVNHKPVYDSVYLQLAALDFDYYLQKPIDSFLTHIPSGYIEMKIVSKGKRAHAGFLIIRYPNDLDLFIYVRGYHYMNPEDPNHVWDITLFRKENLHKVTMFYEGGGVEDATTD